LLVAHDRAVALQRADRKNLVNHESKLPRSGEAIHVINQRNSLSSFGFLQ